MNPPTADQLLLDEEAGRQTAHFQHISAAPFTFARAGLTQQEFDITTRPRLDAWTRGYNLEYQRLRAERLRKPC